MQAKGNFMLQAKWVLQALLGGADIEKIRRHWPGYRIEAAGGRFVFERVDGTGDSPESQLAAGQDGLLGALAEGGTAGGLSVAPVPESRPAATPPPQAPAAQQTARGTGKDGGNELAQARAAAAAAGGSPQSLAPVE